MPIVYLKGDATVPQAKGPKIIAHVVNDKGGWGKGFVLALSKRWSAPEQYYRRWYASKEGFELGAVQVVEVVDNLWVANMVAQRGFKAGSNGIPLQYPALDVCLKKLAEEARMRNASIHMPKIGSGLGGGNWATIESMIEERLQGLRVFVYE